MIKAVIFDLDGVIVSTDECHYNAWKRIADENGIYFDREINNRLRGVSRMESLDIVLERAAGEYTGAEKAEMAEKKNGYYREYIDRLTPDAILPGVSDNLNELKDNGIKIAIGSSSKNTPLILKRIGYEDYFDAVSDGNNITRSKPDPQVFTMAAEMLRLPAEKCLVVEDALAGLQAAAAGGFDSAGLGPASQSGKATHSLRSFRDLLDIT